MKKTETGRTQVMDGREAPVAHMAEAAGGVAWNSQRAYVQLEDNSPAQGPFKVIKTDVRSDSRGRVTIGQEVVGDTQYRALMNKLGQIILDPVFTVPAREIWLLKNPDAFASLLRGVEQAKRGELETFPSFAEFVDQPDEEDEREVSTPRRSKRRRKA